MSKVQDTRELQTQLVIGVHWPCECFDLGQLTELFLSLTTQSDDFLFGLRLCKLALNPIEDVAAKAALQ